MKNKKKTLKEKPPKVALLFKQLIYQGSSDKKAVLASLKANHSFDEIKKVIPHIKSHPIAYKYLFGAPLPKSIDQLRGGFYTYVKSFENEVEWLVFVSLSFRNTIRRFVSLKKLFEQNILLGNYPEAQELLTKIIEETGWSLWALENKLILEELSGGLEKNKEFLSWVNENAKDALVPIFAHFYSNRAERKLTVFRFNTLIRDFLSGLNKEFSEYWNFKVNYFDSQEYESLTDILSFESKSSVVDRYLTFLKVCQEILSTDTNTSVEFIIAQVKSVYDKIKDPYLAKILLKHQPQTISDIIEDDNEVMAVFDSYTMGNYQQSLDGCKQVLLKNCGDLSVYLVYIKSLYLKGDKFEPIDSQKSLVNEILEDLYIVLGKSDLTNQSLTRILKNVYLLDSFPLSRQLYSFYIEVQPLTLSSKYLRLAYLNSFYSNPLFYNNYDKSEEKVSYLNTLKATFRDSITVEFFLEINKLFDYDNVSALNFERIPNFRVDFYAAQRLQQLGFFDKAIETYERLILEKNNTIIYEEVLINLFNCCFFENRYDQCIQLYVTNYLKNDNLVLRINYQDIHKRIEKARYKNVKPTIKLPIFFFITKQDNHAINVALRVFLRGLNISRPPELIDFVEDFNRAELIMLLLNVCTPEVLKYSTYFNSTKEILNERLEIFHLLSLIDSSEGVLYKEEIRKISQNLAIIEGIREVDESKIYVDEKGLIINEFKEIENNFNRYIEISNLIKERPFVFIDLISNKKYLLKAFDKSYSEEEQQKAKLSKDFKFELFKELLYEIRDKFLFSNKYGLDSYLSTRIRHGTLLGQIRSQFQNLNLITQKDKGREEYFPNEYWQNNLNVSEEVKSEVQRLLADFSFKVDKIATDLKDKYIQIKTEKRNPEGLFDYTFPNSALQFYFERVFKNLDNYGLFIKAALIFLWDRTKTNLEVVQNLISKEIKEEIISDLINLEKDLKETVINTKEIQELLSNITNCRIQIVTELDKIADWFNIRENIIADFEIEKVIDTSIEITKKISQISNINVKSDINSHTLLKGEYFIHFFDLLRIFFENAVSYSRLSPEEFRLFIQVVESSDNLHIRITNNLSPTYDIEALRDLFASKKEDLESRNWNTDLIKTELGGTGFYKAKKIISTNLQNERNTFSFSINEQLEVEIIIIVDLQKIKA